MSIIDKVLNSVSIVDLISQYTELSKINNGYQGKCNLHEGDGGSTIWVTENPEMFYCFSCGKSGNAAHYLSYVENISFNEAIEKLAEEKSIDIGKNQEWQNQKSHCQKMLDKNRLFVSKVDKVTEYLQGRGLTEETIKEFQFGYSEKVCYKYKNKFQESPGISIPLKDKNGRIIAFAYRLSVPPKYTNDSSNDYFAKGELLFNYDKAKVLLKDRLYICEGYMDAISAHQQGLACVGYMGAIITKPQVQLIGELIRGREGVTLYLAPDADQTGQDSVERMRDRLKILNTAVRVVEIN